MHHRVRTRRGRRLQSGPARVLIKETDIPGSPLWANSGLMHRSKLRSFSITSSARAMAAGSDRKRTSTPFSFDAQRPSLESRGFCSCGQAEYRHLMSVLPVGNEFRESADFGGNQEKIGKRLAQRLGNDQFGWRNAGTNGSKPASERAPYQLGSDDCEILQQPLRDHASLNKDMVSGDLAFDLIPISG